MLLCQLATGLHELKAGQAQALLFEAANNRPDQTTLDTIGFEENQGLLHIVVALGGKFRA
jgi:hypothetical protein